jgi:hypothetical protein
MPKEKFEDIKKKVEDAESYQKDYLINRSKRNVGYYQGHFKTEHLKDLDKIPNNVNLTFSTARTIVSSIYAKNPSFQILIMKNMQDFIDNLKLQGISITKQAIQTAFEYSLKLVIYDMKLHRTNRLALTDCVVSGLGITKLGYKYELDDDIKDRFVKSASCADSSELIKSNKPYILRVNPQNIILPSEASDPNSASWVCEKIYITVEQAKELYNKDLKPEYVPQYTDLREKTNDMVCIYEYHDFYNARIVTYSCGEKLEEKPYPLIDEEGDARPLYDFIWFNDSLSEIVYPVSDIDMVITQIEEANSQIERRINFARKNTPKFFLTGSWSENAINQIKTGEDLEVVLNETGDGRVDFIAAQSLGAEFYSNIMSIKSEMYEILGITDYQVGGQTQNRKATEAQLIDRSRIDRVGERVRIIEEWHYSQIDKLVELIKAYQDIPKRVRVEYNNDVIEIELDKELYTTADMDIIVVPGSTISVDKYEQDAMLMQDIQMASLAPQFINAGELLKQYYQRRGYTNLEKIIPDQGDFQADFGQMPGMQGQQGQPTTTPMARGQLPNLGVAEI